MWSDRKQQLWIWRERGSRVEGQVDWEHRLQSLLAAWKALSAKSQYSSPHSSPHSSLSMLRQEPWKRLIRRPKNNSHTFVHNPRLGSSRQSAEDVSIFHERTSQFHITTTVTTGPDLWMLKCALLLNRHTRRHARLHNGANTWTRVWTHTCLSVCLHAFHFWAFLLLERFLNSKFFYMSKLC